MPATLPEKYRYIVVEGPIGAGKTSLARLMSERTGGTALLEDPDANPFLPGFYQDRARDALPAQLYYEFALYGRVYGQLKPRTPVPIVNSENLNFVDQPGDFDLLLGRMAGMRGPREFFSMGS